MDAETRQAFGMMEERVRKLERDAHPPVDLTKVIDKLTSRLGHALRRIDTLEARLASLSPPQEKIAEWKPPEKLSPFGKESC